eukprot:CFRG0068T1
MKSVVTVKREASVFSLFVGGTPQQCKIGDLVLVNLRSDKDLGRAVIIEGSSLSTNSGTDVTAKPHTDMTKQKEGMAGRVKVQFLHNGHEQYVQQSKLRLCFQRPLEFTNNIKQSPLPGLNVVVCYSTSEYRHLARTIPRADEHVLEIGCSYGKASAILSRNCDKLTAVDVSNDCIVSCRNDCEASAKCVGALKNNTVFHCFDVLADKSSLFDIIANVGCVFVDIGGNRSVPAVIAIINFVERFASAKCAMIIVKSEALTGEIVRTIKRTPRASTLSVSLHSIGVDENVKVQEYPHTPPTHSSINMNLGTTFVPACSTWWEQILQRERTSALAEGERPSVFAPQLYCQRVLPTSAAATVDTTNVDTLITTGVSSIYIDEDTSLTTTDEPASAHTPTSTRTFICRFHNYAEDGCKQYNTYSDENVSSKTCLTSTDSCPYDHIHCHACMARGHIARECAFLRELELPHL